MICICLAVVFEYNNYINNSFQDPVMALNTENSVPATVSQNVEICAKSRHNKVKEIADISWMFSANPKSNLPYNNLAASSLNSLYGNVRGCFQRFCQLEDIPPPPSYLRLS